MKDFFISYNKEDKQWAEWIAWILEKADYEVVIQDWDFRPGTNFVQAMDDATKSTEKTILVLSPNFLDADFTKPEWQAAFARDATGAQRLVVPFRVRECQPTGLLGQIVYADLVGLSQNDAKLAILGAFSQRAKPAEPPAFPGAERGPRPAPRSVPLPIAFPGQATQPEVAESIVQGTSSSSVSAVASAGIGQPMYSSAQLLQLLQKVSGLSTQQFNILLAGVNPPSGKVPTMPTPQTERAQALFQWAVDTGGIGLTQIAERLETLEQPAASRGATASPANTKRARPAMGGDSISHDRGGAATLGCLVRDRAEPSKIYVLSDYHALCDLNATSNQGDAVLQPGRLDGGNRATDLLATLSRWAKVRGDDAAAAQNVSAAIAEVLCLEDVSAEIRGRGPLRGVGVAEPGMKVWAVGRTSGEVSGEVQVVHAQRDISAPYYQIDGGLRGTGSGSGIFTIPFGDLILCSKMSQPGDSGAVLLDADNNALGLGFAGSTDVTLYIPMQRVLDVLEVDLVTTLP